MNGQLEMSGSIRAVDIAVLIDRDVVAMPARMTMMARRWAQPASRDSSPRMTMSRDVIETANKERA